MTRHAGTAHEHHPIPLSALPHLVRNGGHLWRSDVNRAAVALLDPRPGERVLDLGSGLGPATMLLTERVGSGGVVTAVDPSRLMRAILRARSLLAGRPRPVVADGTAASLPLPSGSVDAVVSLNALHHMPDHVRAAAELARVLRPGGRALLLDEDFDHPDHSLHEAGGPAQHGMDPVDPAHLAGLLAAAGFAAAAGRSDTVGGEPARVVEATR